MSKLWWCLIGVVCCWGGCSRKKCDYHDSGVVAPQSEQKAVLRYLDSVGIDASLNERGFYYKIDNPGSGNQPGECSSITVAYTGTLTSGKVFDQQGSYATQLSNLIAGWQQGVPLIKNGGTIRLFIPPSLGYQAQTVIIGNDTIPASSILIFNIHLLDVQ